MEFHTSESVPQPMPRSVRSALAEDRTFGRPSSAGTVLWWVALMLLAATVPALAALALMGSATFAMTIGLLTAGSVGLAALMI